ncbi:hypothetical protein LOC67_05180 [Stieleria sp. JC731]|nr:hypothetical protein [Stieleria sp. JC731]MCC9599945.1 hypothetical protein [Stieleria sp. JC731]
MRLLAYLVTNRHRPKFGSYQWVKYWGKRLRLGKGLTTQVYRQWKYAPKCQHFGQRVAISELSVSGNLNKLSIGDDCAIGRVSIQLLDRVNIGNSVVVNDGANLITGSHDVHDPQWPLITQSITIDDYAWVATGATILPGVTVGRGAVVGAFAVVAKSIPPLAIAVGNPAKVIGYRKTSEFEYQPSQLYALFEAWLGPPAGSTDKQATQPTVIPNQPGLSQELSAVHTAGADTPISS